MKKRRPANRSGVKGFASMNIAKSLRHDNERAMSPGMARTRNGNIDIIVDRVALATNDPRDNPAAENLPYNLNAVRMAAIERLIEYRHGGPVTGSGWDKYLSIALNALALRDATNQWRTTPSSLAAWAAIWLPGAPEKIVEELAQKVAARPRRIGAPKAGQLVGLKEQEWRDLNITTLHPCDVPASVVKAEQKQRKAKKDAERYAKASKETGRMTRKEYIAGSVAEEARREGISRQAIYGRRAKANSKLQGQLTRISPITVRGNPNRGERPDNRPPSSHPLLPDDTRRAAKARLCDAAIAAFSTTPASAARPSRAAR